MCVSLSLLVCVYIEQDVYTHIHIYLCIYVYTYTYTYLCFPKGTPSPQVPQDAGEVSPSQNPQPALDLCLRGNQGPPNGPSIEPLGSLIVGIWGTEERGVGGSR